MEQYDVIVIGSGSGGLTVAYTAVGLGKKVLLVEKSKPGGECTWSGCIPSKTLIHIAKEMAVIRRYQPDYSVNTSEVLAQIRETILSVYAGETPEILKSHHIHYLNGFAKFVNKNTIEVDGQLHTGKKIIIATGTSPFVPNIEGIDEVAYMTNESFFTAETLPSSMIVLGGGAIGVELAMALNDLGIQIDLVEMLPEILPSEEPEFGKLLHEIMVRKGIVVHTDAKAVSVANGNNPDGTKADGVGINLTIEINNEQILIESKSLLVAVGRKPNIDGLELESAKVGYDRKGISVNAYMRTSNKAIYAVGDVASKYQFSHMAYAMGVIAAQNAIFPWKRKMSYKHVAWCTYCTPELARAGLTEAEARQQYSNNVRIYEHAYKDIDRAKTEHTTEGLIKLITNKKGKLLGATILGERAGELICELQVIKTLGISPTKLGKVIHPYPTYSEALSALGRKIMIDRLVNNWVVKLFRK
ncbi:MAG: NAD(P)/FAD-dependent oxidoreductase [Vallitaleaceae bacterium]|jgi:pyruvate/2-oxoglutarate dehydrogenase complex dihydrolipoamide dehydrogenase (E3) component|nr:NAD(P)/FAD-dependent oxidoreductase [Vallitaleaceae bacterium]